MNRALARDPNIKIIYQGTLMSIPRLEADFRAILMDRIKALAIKPKKVKLRKDMGLETNA